MIIRNSRYYLHYSSIVDINSWLGCTMVGVNIGTSTSNKVDSVFAYDNKCYLGNHTGYGNQEDIYVFYDEN